MLELRKKKDEEERIRIEHKKKEDAENLEQYYIMLKMIDYAEKLKEKEYDNFSNKNEKNKVKKSSFFTTNLLGE
jgi:hypothetical protein